VRRHRLRLLQYASSSRLLGIRRRLLDLRLQRESRCDGITRCVISRSAFQPGYYLRNGDVPMTSPRRSRFVILSLVLAALSIAPAAPDDPPKPSPRAEARYQAALKQYEISWSYYQQARIDSYQVYVWSRLVLDSYRDLNNKPADWIVALEAHLDRMKK